MPCENLARFTSPDVATLQARMVPAAGDAPVHCRVSGVLKPEIGFEVNLPMQWNGRFYMIGNGGHAGEGPDDAGRAAQRTEALKLGFAMATTNTGHDGRKEPGASFVLTNPAESDRLCLPRRPSHGDDRQGHHEGVLREARRAFVLELVLERRPPGPDRSPALSG